MPKLRGIVPPVCTPLDPDGAVDIASLERLVRRLLDDGVHALFCLGSSGEAIYLTDAARRTVLDTVVGTVSGAVPVLAGALAGATERVVEQVRWISGYGIDAIVVTAPFYANVSDHEIVVHFEQVAARSRLPIVAYDIPGNVGHKLPTDVTIDLLARDVIVGLKDTSGDLDGFRRILREVGEDPGRTLLCGSDRGAAEWLSAGADGIVPGIGNVCADLFTRLWRAFEGGDHVVVERCQAEIDVVATVLGIGMQHGLGLHASQLGALKHILVRQGIFATERVSPPLSPYPTGAADEVDAILRSIGR